MKKNNDEPKALWELFVKLAKPNEKGISSWVSTDKFNGEYARLYFKNGWSWGRKGSALDKKYKHEERRENGTKNGKIVEIRLTGKKEEDKSSQHINAKIKREIKKQRCVVLGTSNPEVDHKNGMKNEDRVMKNEDQRMSDFQPLSKAANDAKRQFCKECKRNHKRFDAKLLGYPMSYYKGGPNHNLEEDACIGCFWYDPIEFRKHLKKAGN